MAGFRTFATGEVLTAANVNNFLMKQSVMVFADDAARTTALGAEVTEGMLTFNLDTGALEVFDGTNFVPAGAEPPAGIGSNVVSTTLTSAFSASVAAGGASAITGLAVTITPSSDTAKVLVYAMISGGSASLAGQHYTLTRGGTPVAIGDTDGTRQRRTTGVNAQSSAQEANASRNAVIVFLDSPGVATATTYAITASHSSSGTESIHINRSSADSNLIFIARYASSITAIEVAA